MGIRYSKILSNKSVDNIMIRWVCLYIVAREKCKNFNYDDRYKVVNDYIANFYADDYTQYVIDLIKSDDINDKNELLAIQNCEAITPLAFWTNIKDEFQIKDKYFEKRLKYNFDKFMRKIERKSN